MMSSSKRGIVFVAPVDDVPDGSMVSPESRFWGGWESEDGEVWESGVEWDGAEEALAWGRTRARIVIIRLGHTLETSFSAGEIHDGDLELWPPEEPEGGWWRP